LWSYDQAGIEVKNHEKKNKNLNGLREEHIKMSDLNLSMLKLL